MSVTPSVPSVPIAFENDPSGQVRTATLDHITLRDRIERIPIRRLRQAHINGEIYKPIRLDDPRIVELGESIKDKGLLEPLVVTIDNVLVSGHSRRGGCLLAGLNEVDVRRIQMRSSDPRFPAYLVAFNQQRRKTPTECIREEIARTCPDDAHNRLLALRRIEDAKQHQRLEDTGLRILKPGACKRRADISPAKRPMLEAVSSLIERYRNYWPLTLRQIHYRLLPLNVLRNADDRTPYSNTHASYKDLSDLLTRARLSGSIPWEAMHDPTRPRTTWRQWECVADYMRQQLDSFLSGYKRNLLQTQASYVELVVEKITVQDIAQRAAAHFHVPVGVARGYTSTSSLAYTADRFRASAKPHMILLIASDFDPEGENLSEQWAACLRDEHGLGHQLQTVKVALNPEQVKLFNPAPQPVKESSSRAKRFKAAHGSSVYELEALEPDHLQTIIRDAIRSVLDMPLFIEQQRLESEDARLLLAARVQMTELLPAFVIDRKDGVQ